MARPRLEKIVEKMRKGKNFELTREQYIRMTGADTPQNEKYLMAKSAVAKRAHEAGYSITVVSEKLVFVKE